MLSAVLDTNVVVSAHLNSKGATGLILELAMLRHFRCFVSQPLLDEYNEVLQKGRIGLDPQKTGPSMRRFRTSAIMVSPRRRLQSTRDPDDDIVLECALEARADFVVTGNVRDFPSRFQDVRVITPRDFVTVLASSPH